MSENKCSDDAEDYVMLVTVIIFIIILVVGAWAYSSIVSPILSPLRQSAPAVALGIITALIIILAIIEVLVLIVGIGTVAMIRSIRWWRRRSSSK